jgi:NitT/TauT family transport system substrate-binding protein
LLQGQVDATAATDTSLWAAQQALGDVHLVWARAYLNTPTDAFIVSEEFYTTRHEPLVAFLKAYKRGTQWMLAHPDEASQLAVKHAIDRKAPQCNLAIIKLRNAATVDEHTKQTTWDGSTSRCWKKSSAPFGNWG